MVKIVITCLFFTLFFCNKEDLTVDYNDDIDNYLASVETDLELTAISNGKVIVTNLGPDSVKLKDIGISIRENTYTKNECINTGFTAASIINEVYNGDIFLLKNQSIAVPISDNIQLEYVEINRLATVPEVNYLNNCTDGDGNPLPCCKN